ncbi:MAG TPA: hypothetical protein VF498_08255 [Anaerolineales bacterium]
MGQTALVRYPALDMGKIGDAFDGDDRTLMRTFEANPLVLEIGLVQPTLFRGIEARVGGTPQRVTVTVYQKNQPVPLVFSQTIAQTAQPRYASFPFPRPLENVERIRLEMLSINDGEPAHVHLWEVRGW